jgi:transposase
MHPTVRRTWAPVGQTPLLRQRTRCYRKVSAIGGLSISPQRRRLGWYLQFHPNRSIRQEQVIAFLAHLLRHLRGPVIVVWDRLNAHRGAEVRQFVVARSARLTVEYLPAYAPELNPEEYGWAHVKGHTLANFCPDELEELHDAVLVATGEVRTQQALLRSFVHASGLPIRL